MMCCDLYVAAVDAVVSKLIYWSLVGRAGASFNIRRLLLSTIDGETVLAEPSYREHLQKLESHDKLRVP